MEKSEMRKIAKEAFKACVEMADNKIEIFIKDDVFDSPEYEDKNGELDKKLINKLYMILFRIFEQNGYDIYKGGDSYILEGRLVIVDSNTVIAVHRELAQIANMAWKESKVLEKLIYEENY